MRGIKYISLLPLLFSLVSPANAECFRVVSIADGDTITVLAADNQQIKVRLYGVDCPERRQPFGNRARQATQQAVGGRTVDVHPVEIDRYGRTVGIVSVDGYSLGALLVQQGLAWVYPQYCKWAEVCEPLRELERDARAQGRGLWGDREQVPPWEWRRR